jgi:hypothetical protein
MDSRIIDVALRESSYLHLDGWKTLSFYYVVSSSDNITALQTLGI